MKQFPTPFVAGSATNEWLLLAVHNYTEILWYCLAAVGSIHACPAGVGCVFGRSAMEMAATKQSAAVPEA